MGNERSANADGEVAHCASHPLEVNPGCVESMGTSLVHKLMTTMD